MEVRFVGPLAHACQLLEPAGLPLKGEDGVKDLRRGQKAQLLGFTLSRKGGRLHLGLGDDAWTKLERNLVLAHDTPDPSLTARMVVNGWVEAFGPAFERPTERATVDRILETAAEHGFRELASQGSLAFDREHNPVALTGGESLPEQQVKPPWPAGLVPMPAAQVKEQVAKNAGARPWDRDPIDARIVRAALDGTGKIIDSEQDAGGYPAPKETRAPFHENDWNLTTMQRRTR